MATNLISVKIPKNPKQVHLPTQDGYIVNLIQVEVPRNPKVTICQQHYLEYVGKYYLVTNRNTGWDQIQIRVHRCRDLFTRMVSVIWQSALLLHHK